MFKSLNLKVNWLYHPRISNSGPMGDFKAENHYILLLTLHFLLAFICTDMVVSLYLDFKLGQLYEKKTA